VEENLRARLAVELEAWDEPPLDGLVAGALVQGRRLRRVRTAKVVGSLVAACALTVGVVFGGQALVGGHGHGNVPSASGAADGLHLTIAATPSPGSAPVIDQPPGPKSPATAATVAYLLRQLLPPGVVTDYQTYGPIRLRVDFDRGDGLAMIDLEVVSHDLSNCAVGGCSVGPGGAWVRIVRDPTDCLRSTLVQVDHGNGTTVQVQLSTCLLHDAKAEGSSHEALTVAEATAIAADPDWGQEMSADMVTAGAQQFPGL
jgi:hypothetical protein